MSRDEGGMPIVTDAIGQLLAGRVVTERFDLRLGDCRVVMATLPNACVDAIVTDPPYELGFMGKDWDASGIAYDQQVWLQCLRVLKPGGHLLAFSGSRTYHRMACAIEDAGFELRDQIMWLYGSGFPKSLDVSKAIDKARRRDYVLAAVELGLEIPGNNLHDWTKAEHSPGDKWWEEFKRVLTQEQWGAIERVVIGRGAAGLGQGQFHARETGAGGYGFSAEYDITAPASDAARQWEGWGTALKPAHEPICVARKPLEGTVAANVLAHGTGALNIEACRVPTDEALRAGSGGIPCRHEENVPRGRAGEASAARRYADAGGTSFAMKPGPRGGGSAGRWPANVIHDGSDEVLAAFPDAPGQIAGARTDGGAQRNRVYGSLAHVTTHPEPRDDAGSAARFFYCAKADRVDRNEGTEELPQRFGGMVSNTSGQHITRRDAEYEAKPQGNYHPTVKPTDLMAYLCRLVTPPDGVVLDPFMGSGSTGKAAMREGFRFVGIELSREYLDIARARISFEAARVEAAAAEAARQPSLFGDEV